jgi:uncharacterized protein YlzI (FlbEa/FlbD family)
MKLIVCTRPDGTETWINYLEIAAIIQVEDEEQDATYTRIILKSGAEIVVDDTPEDIHNCIIQHDEYSTAFYVGRL